MARTQDFFAENQRLFSSAGGSNTEQEKFNLYGGLISLANDVEDLSERLRRIETAVINIQNRIR